MRRIINILTKNWLLILIIIFGFFLRIYRFPEYVQFLADQGRDAIIIKRIITLEHLPAIGPSTSIGQVYLGPFYYYFIAPWLLIFNFEPIGLAFGVLFFSTLFLLINYFIIKELFNKNIALISTLLISFSYVLIEFSRFSWNPNLLPLFTLLTVYFFIKSLKTNQWFYYLLAGCFLSFSIQLHYLSLFIIPIIGLIYLINFKLKNLKNYLLVIFGFLFFSLPLLIFDLRHNFLNSKNFFKLITNSGQQKTNYLNNFLETFNYLNQYLFNFKINSILVLIILFLLIINFIFIIKKKDHIKLFLSFFFFLLFFFSFYSGPKHPHYFSNLYPIYIIIISYYLEYLTRFKLEKFLVFIFLVSFIFLNFQKYSFLFYKGNNQIEHAKKVADFISKKITTKKFNFAVQPDGWQEDSYLYFLELKNLKPLDRKKVEIGDEMFVVCGQLCDLYNTNSWNIKMFGEFKIKNKWIIDNVEIYKLIHK